jgi:2-iminobutanoate/2-iminopropanoate deaminase
MIEHIFPMSAPQPRGPNTPVNRAGDFLFVSGMGPVDPATDSMSYGDIRHETLLTLNNIRLLLEVAGASLADAVKVQVFLKDGADFQAMNEVYREFFDGQPPTRTTVAVGFVDPVMKIEIDCIAYKPIKEH